MIKEIKRIIQDENRIFKNIKKEYLGDVLGHYKGSAEILVKVISTKEVSQILKYANQHKIKITTRAAGTNLSCSTIPNGGIIIDVSLMNKVLKIDENNMTCFVEAGIVLEDFKIILEEKNFFYPPDPGEKKATVGGNIATNAGGMKAIKYGVTRDYVLGLEVVLANGDIITCGSENYKDCSGYSLKNLLVGSEGTLGIITKCLLKIKPLPKFQKSVLLGFFSLDTALRNVIKIIQSNTNPSTLEFIDAKCIKYGEDYTKLEFSKIKAESYLLVSYDGDDEFLLMKTLKSLKEFLNSQDLVGFEILEDDRYIDVWKIRGSFGVAIEAKTYQEPLDLVVPLKEIANFLQEVKFLEKKYMLEILSFGHAGDGNIHLCILKNDLSDKIWTELLEATLDDVYTITKKLGGLPSAEHGIGRHKRKYFYLLMDEKNIALMKLIKGSFDPNNILNSENIFID